MSDSPLIFAALLLALLILVGSLSTTEHCLPPIRHAETGVSVTICP